MEITGGCLCKAVRYSINAAPVATRACWCRVCQYLGAGNATVNVCFPSNALKVSGALGDYRMVADSGTWPTGVSARRAERPCSAPRKSGRT